MLRMKCCPRCVGDMFLEDGVDGQQWLCLQCGYRLDAVAALGGVHGARLRAVALAAGLERELRERLFDWAADRDLGERGYGMRLPGVKPVIPRDEPPQELTTA